MATQEECRAALERLAEQLAAAGGRRDFDRTVSCTLPDLATTFHGRLRGGHVEGITAEPVAERAQLRFTLSSDDLVAIAGGGLGFGSAFASGRLKVQASFTDLLKLRSMA